MSNDKDPAGVKVGEVQFNCMVSEASILVELFQEGHLMHVRTSHIGVKQHTPATEMFHKMMIGLREE